MTMSEFSPKMGELLARVQALPAARELIARLGDGVPVYLVGGAVRDLLLGGTPFDLDLVVEGDAAAFATSLGGNVKLHDRFGTSTVSLNGFAYDIARARRETYASPGALPDVEPAALAEDLHRRDFTVNALAVALAGERAGELTAVPHALDDLEARRLRVLHDGSFIDDPTRLWRLARYAGRLDFAVEPHTRALADAAIEGGALGTVSGSRLGAEVRLLAREDDPVRALVAVRELGLDRALHPGFGLTEETLARRALALLPPDGRPDRLVLAIASRGVPAGELPGLLDRLAFEAEDRDVISAAATHAADLARALAATESPSAIATAAAGAPPEEVALAGALGPDTQAREWLERLRHVRLSIDGSDLLAAGVPQGPEVGRGLRAALAAKLDGLVHNREEELAEALNAVGRPQ
jgi:tRNA nucleotidyltransferase (CCA-adding enzyme)